MIRSSTHPALTRPVLTRPALTRPVLTCLGALTVAVTLAACSSSSTASPASTSAGPATSASASASAAPSGSSGPADLKGKVIGYVPPVTIPAFVDMYNALKTQAALYGMTVVQAGGGAFDPNGQLEAYNSLIARRVDVIVTPPISAPAAEPVMQRAIAAGIKWIDYDSDLKNPTLSINSNEVGAAGMVATQLAAKLKAEGKPCNLGIVDGAPVVTALVHTAQGFKQGALAAGCTILDTQTDTTNQPTGGQKVGDAWKAKYGSQMTGVLSYVGQVTQGLLSTFDSSFSPLVGSEASSPVYRADIADGKIFVGFDSVTASIGQAAAWSAAQLLSGRTLPPLIIAPPTIETQTSVASLQPADTLINKPTRITLTTVDGKPTFAYSYPS